MGRDFSVGGFAGSGPAATGPRPLPPGLVPLGLALSVHHCVAYGCGCCGVHFQGRKERPSGAAEHLWLRPPDILIDTGSFLSPYRSCTPLWTQCGYRRT